MVLTDITFRSRSLVPQSFKPILIPVAERKIKFITGTTSSPKGNNSKCLIILLIVLFISNTANFCPIQLRGPAEKAGMILPSKSKQIKTKIKINSIKIPSNKQYSPNSTSCSVKRPIIGTGGYKRKLSFITTSKYFKSCNSLIVTVSTSSRISSLVSGLPATVDCSSTSRKAMRFLTPISSVALARRRLLSSESTIPICIPVFERNIRLITGRTSGPNGSNSK
ncbi:hypothetical protein FF38_03392 [Lucilia cuprina]|uniref:Uncharacterized protein n=1 Tax=Lucilia cuprina TaxID=7375 RepID=A0A0L0C059_LUCCU|nr:hypothetical protein FF38_03392 [Lucilia cuprina]